MRWNRGYSAIRGPDDVVPVEGNYYPLVAEDMNGSAPRIGVCDDLNVPPSSESLRYFLLNVEGVGVLIAGESAVCQVNETVGSFFLLISDSLSVEGQLTGHLLSS
jgi:hypothetical protein